VVCSCWMTFHYLSSGWTVFKNLLTVNGQERCPVNFDNQWDSGKNSINCNHSFHFFIHHFFIHLISSHKRPQRPSPIIYNNLRLILWCVWDHCVNRRGTFWAILRLLWLIGMNTLSFVFSPIWASPRRLIALINPI
jgi:hypothetical protein